MSKHLLQKQIGQRIAMARDVAGVSQVELADAVGLSRTQITNIEAGRSDVPATRLIAIATALGIKTGRLLP